MPLKWLSGASRAVQLAFCCLPGRTIAFVLHLEPPGLSEGRSLRAGLWSLPGNPTGFLEPPGPPIQLSWSIWGLPDSPNRGASRLPNRLAASRAVLPGWLFCCLLGCPRRSLESPKQSKWLSGASRAAQIALVVHELALCYFPAVHVALWSLGVQMGPWSPSTWLSETSCCLPGCPNGVWSLPGLGRHHLTNL